MAFMTAPQAAAKGSAAALIDERGSTSWAALNDRANQLMHWLSAQGVQPGDRVAIFAGNCREYYELFTAAGHLGLFYVPINWHFTAEELQYVVQDSEARLLFIEGPFETLAETLTGIEIVSIRGKRFQNYEDCLAGQSTAEPEQQYLGGPMFYTSGTTGRPKGVKGKSGATGDGPPPIEAMQLMTGGLTTMLQLPADGTTYLCGPVYHSAQWAFSFLPLMAGSRVVSRHKFDPAESLQVMAQYEVTNVHLVPTQFQRFLQLNEAERSAFNGDALTVAWHGAAPCPPAVKRAMIDWWGPKISEYYGSTEGSIVAMASAEEWLAKPGTVGKPSPMVNIRILDDEGNEVSANTAGEIYVKSLMGNDFEYHNEPEKTAAAHLEPGVFTFGDIGYFDDDGYLYLSDRKIDMIISGGVNIYPAELEGVLAMHPAVQDAAVFGIPNEEYGEEVKAAVTLTAGQQPGEALTAELMAYCREHLAGYKTPRSIDYLEEMPRHETGKLYKRLLKEPYWDGTGRSI